MGRHPVAVVINTLHMYGLFALDLVVGRGGRLHGKHVAASWNIKGNHLSICSGTQGNRGKPVSRWPVAGPSGY